MQPVTRGSLTNEAQIQVNWLALTGNDTRGAPILSYYLQWDKGTNAAQWFDLVGFTDANLLLTFTVTSDVFGGQ
jgi:hypothetical protein